ncbi:hypothetical protein ON010_g16341 [Phytophthora cinnamomi]|nr:hypothetical protein ON010_g16341 [Phytophthora cinnamomi]
MGASDNENAAVRQVLEQEVQTNRGEGHQDVQVEEVGRPGGGLVLAHRGNNRDVLGRVRRVQQGQTTTGPLHLAHQLQNHQRERNTRDQQAGTHQYKTAERRGRDVITQPVDEAVHLQQHEDAVRAGALGLLDNVEAHKGHLHGHEAAQGVKRRVGDVQARGVAAGEDHHQHVDGDHVDDEHVAAPGRHHVEVRERAGRRPEHGSRVHGLDPEVEDEDEREDGDAFVVVRAADRAGDVRRHDAREGGGQEPGARALGHLLGQQVAGDGRVGREERRQEHARVAHVDGDVEQVEHPVHERRRVHEPRVDGAADDAAQRVPRAVVEPVEELEEALGRQVLGRAEVEVRVELVDHLQPHDTRNVNYLPKHAG